MTGTEAEERIAASDPRAPDVEELPAIDAIPAAGDLETVYKRDLSRLTGLAEWIVGSRSIAEELVHDTFARAVAKPPKVGEGGSLSAYMRASVVNACNSRLRRFAVERKHRASRLESYEDPPRPDEDVRDAVQGLPLRQRQVVVLRFYEDMTIDQIAADLDISSGSVKTHLHRALKTLGAALDENRLDERLMS